MRFQLALSLALLASSGLAQMPTRPPGTRNPELVTAGTYAADRDHTLVVWTLDHMGFSPYTGIFGDVTGTLEVDPKNIGGSQVDVTIPISKVVTASPGLTRHLLKPAENGGKADFFGLHPADARFVSRSVVADGQAARIIGDLTLNNVTRPVTLEATFYGAGKAPAEMGGQENVGFKATGTLLRSQFGLGYGVPVVGDAVELRIAAAFQKQR